jgi:hypothetical protein
MFKNSALLTEAYRKINILSFLHIFISILGQMFLSSRHRIVVLHEIASSKTMSLALADARNGKYLGPSGPLGSIPSVGVSFQKLFK